MKPISKSSVLEQVVQELTQFLASGDISEGEKLPPESELGKTLGVGRSTIREALRVLQTRGMITVQQGRGAFVERTVPDDPGLAHWFSEHRFELEEFFEVRIALESLAVRLAAERATVEELHALDRSFTAFATAADAEEWPRLSALDEEFHTLIATAAHNRLLAGMNQMVVGNLKEYRATIFIVPRLAYKAVEPHQAIFEAIRNGDAERGVLKMVEHMRISMEDIAFLTEVGEAGAGTPGRSDPTDDQRQSPESQR